VVNRFLREGDVLTRLDHPNLVKVHDLVVEGGRLGLVMDLVEPAAICTPGAGGAARSPRRKRHGSARRPPERWPRRTLWAWCTSTSNRPIS
jgi:hypothetical protein